MTNPQLEVLLNKSEIDRTFSFNRIQWSEAASEMIAPGWRLRICENESGAQVVGFDPSTNVGLSVKPYFRDDTHIPDMVIIANYFPLGMLPPISKNLHREMQAVAQRDIGHAYSVILKHGIINQLEMFEYVITEL